MMAASKCWGANNYGQLGNGTTTLSWAPVNVCADATCMAPLGNVVDVAAFDQSCAVINDGTVKCWGSNEDGELGDGTLTNRNTPVGVPGLGGVTRAVAGGGHTCALLSTGTMKCWGEYMTGQVGNGSGPGCILICHQLTPAEVCAVGTIPPCSSGGGNVLAGVTSITAGASHTCARLSTGALACWGRTSIPN